MQEKLNIAVFVDYDNIEIGLKSTLRREFDVSLALDALKERGANYVQGGLFKQFVVRDGNLITSRKPDDIPAFNERLIREISQGKPTQITQKQPAKVAS